jgi:putative aminopeptidase FrvX
MHALGAAELLARAQKRALQPVPPAPWVPPGPVGHTSIPTDFTSSVRFGMEDGAHVGKKLGSLAAAAAISTAIPLELVLHVPAASIIAFGPIGLVGGMIAASLEERYIGVGKRLGAIAGGALGVAAGAARGGLRALHPPSTPPEKISLEKRAPSGRPMKEALVPALVHAAERKLTGSVAAPTQAAGMGEAVGATLATLVGAYAFPSLIGAVVGGPVGLALSSTLIGPLTGMILGGAVENVLGVGRAAGEWAGRGIARLQKPHPAQAAPVQSKGGGALLKGFLEVNHIIAEPITSYLIDGSLTLNKLFSEKPIQTIEFAERPSPSVNRQRLVESFTKLVGISGPSDHEEDVSKEIQGRLDALKIPYVVKADHTIIATVPGTVKDAPTVVLSAHMDTVGPTVAKNVRNDGRRIYTNERQVLGGDDRAGCAEILEGVERVLETGADHPELKLVFDVCEEGGLKGAARLSADDISLRPALGYVMDALDPADINLTNDAVFVNSKSVKYAFSQEDPVVQVAMKAMADSGCRPRPMHVPIMAGAGSDANTAAYNNARIRSIALGAGEHDIHSPLETIKIDDLEQSARHVVGVIQNACDLRVDGDDIVARQTVA